MARSGEAIAQNASKRESRTRNEPRDVGKWKRIGKASLMRALGRMRRRLRWRYCGAGVKLGRYDNRRQASGENFASETPSMLVTGVPSALRSIVSYCREPQAAQ